MHVFEYAVIRVVPRVEREEFINIGVILYCSRLKYLAVLFGLNENRLQAISADLDIQELKNHLKAFEKICSGEQYSGSVGQLDQASRFRWLTATRSTVVQCSKVHPGLCDDAAGTLIKLYQQLVL